MSPTWESYIGPHYSVPMRKSTMSSTFQCSDGEMPKTTVYNQQGACTEHMNDIQRYYYLCPLPEPGVETEPVLKQIYTYKGGYEAGIKAIADEFEANDISTVFELHWFDAPTERNWRVDEKIESMNEVLSEHGMPISFEMTEHFMNLPMISVDLDTADEFVDEYSVDKTILNVFCPAILLSDSGRGFATMPGDLYNDIFLQAWYNSRKNYILFEMGEWLGLFPTYWFECDVESHGDYVADTPMESASGECGNPVAEEYANFMSTSHIGNHYTPGQVFRMMIFAFWRKTGRMPEAARQFPDFKPEHSK